MAAGDSDVSICNMALIHLGEDAIVSRSPPDNTKRAGLCYLLYDPARRAALRSHPWRCARTRAALPALTAAPAFGYEAAYQKPSDYLRALDLPDDDMPRWEVEGDTILSDQGPPLNIVYIRDLTDVTRMDSLLVEVIALELAISMCVSLTQSTERKTELKQELADKLGAARSVSAQEASPQEWDDDILLRSRA